MDMVSYLLGLYSVIFASGIGIALLISVVIGVVCGLAPLICGIIEKKWGLGIGGFFACVVLSLLGLWIPTAVFFIFLIYKDRIFKSKESKAGSEAAAVEE